jgi:hypothetical protein
VFTEGPDRDLDRLQADHEVDGPLRPHPYEFHLYYDICGDGVSVQLR